MRILNRVEFSLLDSIRRTSNSLQRFRTMSDFPKEARLEHLKETHQNVMLIKDLVALTAREILNPTISTLATNMTVDKLETELKADIAELRKELKADIKATNDNLDKMRT